LQLAGCGRYPLKDRAGTIFDDTLSFAKRPLVFDIIAIRSVGIVIKINGFVK
jgi:hypothetical protein